MKIRCECGHVICDQTDSLPYKCDLLPDDGYWDNIHQPIVDGILDFVKAIAEDDRSGWLSRHFGAGYPQTLDDSSVISDFIAARMSLGPTAYQCVECGMMLIPNPNSNGYLGFKPIGDDWAGALSWRK